MLTPLEREMLSALDRSLRFAKLVSPAYPVYSEMFRESIKAVIARAEAKERESAQQAHERMIALRQAECPDDGSYLNATGGRL